MKRFLSVLLSSGLLLLSGCADSGSHAAGEGYIPVESVYSTSNTQLNGLTKENPYDNLDFSEPVLQLSPDIGDLYDLNLSYGEFSQENMWELFNDSLLQLFPESEMRSDENYYYFISETVESYFNDEGVLIHPNIYKSDYLKRIKSGELQIESFLYQTDLYGVHDVDEYFWMMGSYNGLVKMNRGTCMRLADKERSIAGWMPRDDYPVIAQCFLPDTTAFMLDNGQVTVDGAASFCEDYFANTALYTKDIATKLKVSSVNVLQIDDDKYAYLMFLARSYAGVPFDAMNMEGGISDFSDNNKYIFASSEALMTRSDEIEYCYLSSIYDDIKPTGKRIDNIISLEKAADIVSESMTHYITFQVENISLVYCCKLSDEEGLYATASANWRFQLHNPNDDRTYVVFVNAVDGHCFYYYF